MGATFEDLVARMTSVVETLSQAVTQVNTGMVNISQAIQDSKLAAEERFVIEREDKKKDTVFQAPKLERQSGKDPKTLYAWFQQVETIAEGNNVSLEDSRVRARVSGYFDGELKGWYNTNATDKKLATIPWADFKKLVLAHYGLWTSKEVAGATLLKLCTTRHSNFSTFTVAFNNTLQLLINELPDSKGLITSFFVLTMYRQALPTPLISLAAEYTGDNVIELEDYIKNRLTRDSTLASQVGFSHTLSDVTPMDLGLSSVVGTTTVGTTTTTPAPPPSRDSYDYEVNFNRSFGRGGRTPHPRGRGGRVSFRGRGRGVRVRGSNRGFSSRGPSRPRSQEPRGRSPSRSFNSPRRSNTPRPMNVDACHRCKKPGHWATECTAPSHWASCRAYDARQKN